MARDTSIAWTNSTVNFAFGCFKVDIDPLTGACVNCFAERLIVRYGGDFNTIRMFNLEKKIQEISKLPPEKELIFLMDMSDIFGEFFSDEQILEWHHKVIEAFPNKQFQLLTKRIGRAMAFYRRYYNGIPAWNVWMGTSIGAKDRLQRLDQLRQIGAKIRWVSFEPLLEDLGEFSLKGIQWAIVGGESDPKHPRPMKPEWAVNIRRICKRDGVAYFLKQLGGVGGDGAGGNVCPCCNAPHQEFPDIHGELK